MARDTQNTSEAPPTLDDLPPPPSGKTGWPWTKQSEPLPETQPDGTQWPKISIVTPSYNQGHFIEETIRSVLLQGYPNLEYFIVDGGSTDDTVDIIQKYDPWINDWVSEPDEGQAHALNKGFSAATGKIRAYLNSDDYYFPGALKTAATAFEEKESDLFCGTTVKVPEETRIEPTLSEEITEWLRRPMASIPQPSSFWRDTGSLPKFDEGLDCTFDRKFFMQLVARGSGINRSSAPIAAFRVHDESKTSRLSSQFRTENMKVNYEMLKEVDSSKRSQLRDDLQFREARHRFHQLPPWSIPELAKLLWRYPRFLKRRELYGRLRRWIAPERASTE